MRFRIRCCCACDEEEKAADNGNAGGGGIVPPEVVPPVVTEQPKPTETIQLDRITEVSVEESSVQITKEEEPVPDQETDHKPPTPPCTTVQPPILRVTQTSTPFSSALARSSLNFHAKVGDDLMEFCRIQPGFFRGSYKDNEFTILNDQLQSTDGAYSSSDKESIMEVYFKAMQGLEDGMKGLQAGILASTSMSSMSDQQLTPTAGSTININNMSFKVVGPGHFRTTHNGKEYSVLNGKVVAADGVVDYGANEIILLNYFEAILGMQKGMRGMQTGLLGMNAGLTSMNTTQPTYSVLAGGQETLKRMRSLINRKRPSILEGGTIAQPMTIEDITEKSNKSRLVDEVDGQRMSNIPEPVLKKTTFTPQALIYEDPKTYEKLDKDELPSAQRLDQYIISLDETVKAGNRYYFHDAKPKRVRRKQLSPKEQLQIASVDRYSLFESESVKAHNEYRKIHGVPPLVNNEFLCQVAREWAEHLALKDAFYHRPKNEYGENLYYADGMPVCAKKAVTAWYDEIDLYDYKNPKFSKETGHFTQLVWKDTREMGTGVAQIGDKVWVCCNYHPPGNFTDKFNDEYVPRPLIKRVPKL